MQAGDGDRVRNARDRQSVPLGKVHLALVARDERAGKPGRVLRKNVGDDLAQGVRRRLGIGPDGQALGLLHGKLPLREHQKRDLPRLKGQVIRPIRAGDVLHLGRQRHAVTGAKCAVLSVQIQHHAAVPEPRLDAEAVVACLGIVRDGQRDRALQPDVAPKRRDTQRLIAPAPEQRKGHAERADAHRPESVFSAQAEQQNRSASAALSSSASGRGSSQT